MTLHDSWNFMVELQKQASNALSGQVSSNWESIFCNILNYSTATKEVKINTMGNIAASDGMLDFSVNKSFKDNFFCYVKVGPLIDFGSLKEKLYSALRYQNLDLGILVAGPTMYLCDYTGFSEKGILGIDFFNDNWAGFRFIELFFRDSFDSSAVKKFIHKYKDYKINVVDQSLQESKKSARKQQVYNSINIELIHELLKMHFAKNVSPEEWEEIKKLFDISLTKTPSPGFVSNVTGMIEQNRMFDARANKGTSLSDIGLLSKNEAIAFCQKSGIELNEDVVYCSENKTGGFYFVNVHKDLFSVNFTILLNDRTRRELNVFNIISNAVSRSKFALKDRNTISLQISSRDNLYRDSYSRISFDKFLEHTIPYTK